MLTIWREAAAISAFTGRWTDIQRWIACPVQWTSFAAAAQGAADRRTTVAADPRVKKLVKISLNPASAVSFFLTTPRARPFFARVR
ncbi:hypothetical protein J3P77_08380 [Pseudomonas sp. R1-18]|uniref:hypothetical protein n=1 Tax=Pseudomonas sp. R1-18 TaxID=1632772 RepID=UPI003DA8A7CB